MSPVPVARQLDDFPVRASRPMATAVGHGIADGVRGRGHGIELPGTACRPKGRKAQCRGGVVRSPSAAKASLPGRPWASDSRSPTGTPRKASHMRHRTGAELMTRDVVRARRDLPFKEIVKLLAENAVTAVPVVNELDRPMGVVSEADLLRKSADLSDPTGRTAIPHLAAWERAKAEGPAPRNWLAPSAVTVEVRRGGGSQGIRRIQESDSHRRTVVQECRRCGVRRRLPGLPDRRCTESTHQHVKCPCRGLCPPGRPPCSVMPPHDRAGVRRHSWASVPTGRAEPYGMGPWRGRVDPVRPRGYGLAGAPARTSTLPVSSE